MPVSADNLLSPPSSNEKVGSTLTSDDIFREWADEFRELIGEEDLPEKKADSADSESASDENVSRETEGETKEVPTLIVDTEGEPANREGSTIMCSAKQCAHNVGGNCGRDEVRLRYNGESVECHNFQPMQPTKGVKNPPPSYENDE